MSVSDLAAATFLSCIGSSPAVIAHAPGRVNLIGEHTDYNDGFVLPCAIGKGTAIAAGKRGDNLFRVIAADYDGAEDCFALDAPITALAGSTWQNYVRGIVKVMIDAGHDIGGCDIVITGDVPKGAGLSSSASLEVAIGFALRELWDLQGLTPTKIALLGQKAENEFVGCGCGIMDQLISATAKAGHAMRIDCRDLSLTPAAIPSDLAIMIVHSGISRGLVDGAYNERRAQCEEAAQILGVTALRDADLGMLENKRAGMDQTVYRRARHVISENARTLEMSGALTAGDLQRMGELMTASHISMRDDFEITVPGIDSLVEVMQAAIGSDGGARMTGGGFGGAAVALLRTSKVGDIIAAINAGYRTPAGSTPEIMIETAAGGAAIIRSAI
jgi:galactokinase